MLKESPEIVRKLQVKVIQLGAPVVHVDLQVIQQLQTKVVEVDSSLSKAKASRLEVVDLDSKTH